ncbi:PREDICTED: uncharacterized protein LOC108370698 [Rhagoletis zephyria]|uniref:uncharacterized protein LOC108370698 n=1 Tax=Rhagoletis zephyria TaxID=28612 RepID=UPI0008116CFC|nr:PREDICTED: uncharacterized protein LOC108370698 [Rhagoletis zephyria]
MPKPTPTKVMRSPPATRASGSAIVSPPVGASDTGKSSTEYLTRMYEKRLAAMMAEFKKQMHAMQNLFVTNNQQTERDHAPHGTAEPPEELQPGPTIHAERFEGAAISEPLQPLPGSQAPRGIWSQPSSAITSDNRQFRHKKIYPLPTFSGLPEEWQVFVEAFESTTRDFEYSNLHHIMRLRDALKDRAKETVEALLANSNNVATIMEKRNLLADYWKRYNDFRDDISAADVIEGEEGKVKTTLSEARLATIESAYCEALGEIHDEIEEFDNHGSDNHPATILNHTCGGSTNTSASKLPKIILPKFDGSFQKWLSFKDMFTTCVINEACLSDVQRLHYLKGSLLGEAETLLRSISIQENNFAIAWDMLQQRYDNKRRLVKSYLRNITKLPAITNESDSVMRKLLDTTTESVRALKQLGRPTEHWDDWLVLLVTEKLDPATVNEWEMSLESPNVLPEYTTLVQFLEKRIQGIEAASSASKPKTKEPSSNNKSTALTSIRSHQTNVGRCLCCSGKHALMYCAEFKRKEPATKLELTLKFKLCQNCLKANHSTNECQSSYTCLRCSQKNHTLLHDSLSLQRSSVAALHTCPDHSVNRLTSYAETCLPAVLLATAYIKAQSSTGQYIKLRALLDNGSQASFISEYAAQQLRLRRNRLQIPITGLGGHSVGDSKGIVTYTLRSFTDPEFSVNCSALILPRLGNLLPLKRVNPKPYIELLDLTLADPNFYEPCSIDVIIGADLYGLLVKGGIKHTACGSAIAQNTYLGWVIYGRIPCSASPQLCTTHFTATTTDDLSSLVQQMWKFHEFDEILPPSKMTQDELFCEEFFKDTVQRTSSGRYQIRYPFKADCDLTKLSNSKADAIKLFRSQQARLRNDPEMDHLYTTFMTEYLALGHMEKKTSH